MTIQPKYPFQYSILFSTLRGLIILFFIGAFVATLATGVYIAKYLGADWFWAICIGYNIFGVWMLIGMIATGILDSFDSWRFDKDVKSGRIIIPPREYKPSIAYTSHHSIFDDLNWANNHIRSPFFDIISQIPIDKKEEPDTNK